MTTEDWKKYGRYCTNSTHCPVCGKPITKYAEGITYVKTKSGAHRFICEKCAGLKGESDD